MERQLTPDDATTGDDAAGGRAVGPPGREPALSGQGRGSVVLRGLGVGRGAVVAPVVRAHPTPPVIPTTIVPDVEDARAAAARAFEAVAARLADRATRLAGRRPRVGQVAELLRTAAAAARHPALLGEVDARILAGQGPAAAVDSAVTAIADTLAVAGDAADRVLVLRSVRDRVLAELAGLPEPGVPTITRRSVLVAEDLSPADTALLDPDTVVGIVLGQGGPTGHTAIIARQLGTPCVVQVGDLSALADGVEVAVDADAGTVVVAPDDEVRRRVVNRTARLASLEEDRQPAATADGHPVELLVNIGSPEDAARGAAHGAGGVGLYRTESLFHSRNGAPDVAEQTAVYAEAFRAMAGRPVLVRTVDAGSDKPLDYLGIGHEENPALGVRGFRLTRRGDGLLRDQLTAIVRAGELAGAEPWVMAPMISTAEEAKEFADLAHRAGLRRVGAMIEVPSAAIRVMDLLGEVDFVSIGTNDLAQYTMATDRMRGELGDLLDPWQPAVLELVGRVAEAGEMTGKHVGVCGESAADPLMALVLTGMGVSSLSMSPAALGTVRFALRHHTFEQCREIASWAIHARSAEEARRGAVALASEEVRELLALGR